MRGELGPQKMDHRGEYHRKSERLKYHFQDTFTVFSHLLFIGHMIQMTELFEIVQIKKAEEYTEAVVDFQIQGEEAEREEQ